MSLLPRKVGLIVDRNFGRKIAALARTFHVWVVASPTNSPVIEQFWKSESPASDGDPLAVGITSFVSREQESAEAICARLAGEVDEHHGDGAQEPPWSEIEVFGAQIDPTLRKSFEDIGVTSFEPTKEGFVCRRTLAGTTHRES